MGNRAYFYSNNKEWFFEANNSLPFFWVSILDKAILDSYREAWVEYDKLSDSTDEYAFEKYDENHGDRLLNFRILKEDFERNAKRSGVFISKYYPEAYALFLDFQKFILENIDDDDVIIFNAAAIAAFEERPMNFYEKLHRIVQNIEMGNLDRGSDLGAYDLIATGIGFASHDFSNFSEAYKEAMNHRKKPNLPIGRKEVFNRKSLFFLSLIVAVCPVFSYIVATGYRKDGFSTMVVLFGFFNMLFYLISISGIINEIKAWIKEKS